MSVSKKGLSEVRRKISTAAMIIATVASKPVRNSAQCTFV
jgi:hypothetical protein